MGMIPDFTLPSNPGTNVRLREATVSDAIDFSGVAPEMEEAATSLFLDRLQDKGKWTDPRRWTGEDRRFALYWYWLHVEKDHEIALSYSCSKCGGKHTSLFDFRKMSEGYTPITGKPERDVEAAGFQLTVRPLNGDDLEKLESQRIGIAMLEQAHGPNSGPVIQAKTRMELTRLVMHTRFADEPEDRGVQFRERRIEGMTLPVFEEFATAVYEAVDDMRHGLECDILDGKVFLITAEFTACQENPTEVGPRLRVPFRDFVRIPRIL